MKLIIILITAIFLIGCQPIINSNYDPDDPIVGVNIDEHGCNIATPVSWCESTQECEPFDTGCPETILTYEEAKQLAEENCPELGVSHHYRENKREWQFSLNDDKWCDYFSCIVDEETRTTDTKCKCIDLYEPVCGKIKVECIAAPCDPVEESFSNHCMAKEAGAIEIKEGVCEGDTERTFNSFKDCIDAGFPPTDFEPRQCRVNHASFVEGVCRKVCADPVEDMTFCDTLENIQTMQEGTEEEIYFNNETNEYCITFEVREYNCWEECE